MHGSRRLPLFEFSIEHDLSILDLSLGDPAQLAGWCQRRHLNQRGALILHGSHSLPLNEISLEHDVDIDCKSIDLQCRRANC